MVLRGALGQKGITGLETAIVLIAFVVVASVFAFTILSAGVFSSEANKQTIHAGLKETRTGLRQHGSAFAFAGFAGSTQAVFKIVFIVSNSLAGEPVDLTPPYSTDDSGTDPDLVNGSTAATIVSYADENQRFSDLPWSMTFIGSNNGDTLLEDGEKVEITVWLMDRATTIAVGWRLQRRALHVRQLGDAADAPRLHLESAARRVLNQASRELDAFQQ